MKAGNIIQLGRPREIYQNPNSRFRGVHRYHEHARRTVDTKNGERYTVPPLTADGRWPLDSTVDVHVSQEVVVSIRPSVGSPRQPAGEVPNEWKGTVVNRAFLGEAVDPRDPRRRARDPGARQPVGVHQASTDVFVRVDPTKQPSCQWTELVAYPPVPPAPRLTCTGPVWWASQIGTRGTVAPNLYQVYDLTGSITYTGLVGAAQAWHCSCSATRRRPSRPGSTSAASCRARRLSR